jgi:hypothetical protein
MFIETHRVKESDPSSPLLTFAKSTAVRAYPCGRRRGQPLGVEGSDTCYIPFDPEARLNTEANNRKYSSLNGFKQTYLKKLDNKELIVSLAGYLFTIKLNLNPNEDIDDLASYILTELNAVNTTDVTSIYANIRLEDIKLFDGNNLVYTTTVLRNQSETNNPSTALDLLKTATDYETLDPEAVDNYYFSGISFSCCPITENVAESEAYYLQDITKEDGTAYQQVISLHILEKINGTWQVYKPALLPHIEHGDTAGSIKMGDLTVDNLNVETDIKLNNVSVPSMKLEKDGNAWRLCFSGVDIVYPSN